MGIALTVLATSRTYEGKGSELRTRKPSAFSLKQIHVSVFQNNMRDV
jgi:hypothetical protein